MAWKTGDLTLDILHEVEDAVEEMEHWKSKEEFIDNLVNSLLTLKAEVIENKGY